jgi:signal peptidase
MGSMTMTPNGFKRVSKVLILIIIVYTASRAALFGLRFIFGTDYPIVVVESTSMLPTLKEGDMLLLRGVKDENGIEIGEIIVFYNPNPNSPERIVHRVKETRLINGELYFITKGDNNPIPDQSPVSQENVIGVVSGKIPAFLSHYILFTDNLIVKISMFGLVVVVFAIGGFNSQDQKNSL